MAVERTPATKLAFCFLLCLETISTVFAASQLEINLFAPVNPVNQDGFMSIYCQIWNLQDTYEVTMSRRLKGSQHMNTLSYSKSVLGEIDDRFMLAVRTLNDGSTVYFLSILEVTRFDEGDYVCKVREGDTVVGVSTVTVEVNFFPEESSPLCSSSLGLKIVVNEGEEIILNCSSTVGKPSVDFKWTSTGVHSKFQRSSSVNGIETDGLSSILRYRPSIGDNGAIFMCEILSPAFPEITRRGCHIGPIKVERDVANMFLPPTVSQMEDNEMTDITDDNNNNVGNTNVVPGLIFPTHATSVNCKNTCPRLNYQVYYWILATVVFSLVAFVFVIAGFCLLLRYNRLTRESNSAAQQIRVCNADAEETYEQLEYHSDRKVYMALDKSWAPTHGHQLEHQTHYNVTPMMSHVPIQQQYHHS